MVKYGEGKIWQANKHVDDSKSKGKYYVLVKKVKDQDKNLGSSR